MDHPGKYHFVFFGAAIQVLGRFGLLTFKSQPAAYYTNLGVPLVYSTLCVQTASLTLTV